MKEKFISTNELANDASKILHQLTEDEATVVMRYSEPVAALVSYADYAKIKELEKTRVNECKTCLGILKRKK